VSLLSLEGDGARGAGADGQRAPVLIIGVGNRARGDDAIGPLLLERLRAGLAGMGTVGPDGLELLETYQLQPEHALDLHGRHRVLVIDATAHGPAPFVHGPVEPDRAPAFTTHSLSPAALAGVHERLYGRAPALEVLAVRGERFGLGEPLSSAGADNLAAALRWLLAALGTAPVLPARPRSKPAGT
jgi:hydrogenase maturation protease